MKPTIGRIVHYRLTENDIEKSKFGYDNCNPHSVGQIVPLLIVVVWEHEFGQNKPGVNGQAFLDGAHSLWITSAGEGDTPGTWHWPEKV